MNQSPTIFVPAKRTDEVDWATPLKRYIQTTYQEDPEKYADEANAIHRLRQDMRGAGKDVTGRDLLYRYYSQLELLDLRFPVDENHIRVSFTWYDAFTHKATSQFSLAYEKASVIFNIASVLSAIAASQNRSEPEGLKRAFHFFQASAERYTYINDNFLHAPSTDLSRDTVKLLTQLMLTQSQECFLEQSLGNKNKPALVAKLAAQAGWSYGNIVENMGDLISRSVFDRSWLTVCQVKYKYLTSIAQYQKSLACEKESKYGECVSRLNIAESLAKEANKLSNNFVSAFSPTVTPTLPPDTAISLQELTKSNLALITEKKNSATKDNDIIYHEVVPQESVISPIDKLNAVKPMPIQELYGVNEMQKVIGQDIFQRLIPLSVHESASLYSEEKAKMVRGETERCDVSNSELEAALEYMKLPGALVKFKTNNESTYLNEFASPTLEVIQWSQLIKTEEEQKGTIKELLMTLNGLKGRAKEILDESFIILDNEQRGYDGMKVKYGILWTQPSNTLTAVFHQDLNSHKGTLEKAANSDQHLFQKYDQSLNDIMILRMGENGDDLEKIFAETLSSINTNTDTFVGGRRISNAESLLDVDTSKSEENTNVKVHKVEACLENLNKIRKERMDTLNDLKEKVQNIEPQLFATELEKFSPYRNRITASIHHQQALLQELTTHYKSLMESDESMTLQSRWDLAERKRKEVCDRFKKAKDNYLEVKEGLRKGIQFYSDLTEVIENLSKTLHKSAKSRQQERNELVHSLQEQQIVKNKLISSSIPSSNQAINHYESLNQLAEDTNKLSLNSNIIPIDINRDSSTSTIPQTQSNVTNFYNNTSHSYTSSVRKDSNTNPSAPPYVPIAPPKPSAPSTLTLGSSNNYFSQGPTSFSAQPSIYNTPSSPKLQGPPLPPLPTGYQQQNIVHNTSPSNIQRSYQPALLAVSQSQQTLPQQSPILHQNHSFNGQYTQLSIPPQPSQGQQQIQQHGLSSTPSPPVQQPPYSTNFQNSQPPLTTPLPPPHHQFRQSSYENHASAGYNRPTTYYQPPIQVVQQGNEGYHHQSMQHSNYRPAPVQPGYPFQQQDRPPTQQQNIQPPQKSLLD
ncbi:11117_t:CDS:2 [Funneliformis geosporum]|nr:11117_t:CDS:2 [Funneliformis geosporum]